MPPCPPPIAHHRARVLCWLVLTAGLEPSTCPAQVRLNEFTAATSQRQLLADDRGRVRPGSGTFWTDPDFAAPGWLTGTAPLGYGGVGGLGTNVSAMMQNRTPNLYLRRVINLTPAQAANEGQLQLRVRFDDGFIAWLNGREIARSNTGPAGHYIYADQKAYNFAAATTNSAYTPSSQSGMAAAAPGTGITYTLGQADRLLQTGDNILAVQLVNREPGTSARIDAQLQVVTGNAVVDLARYSFDEANDSAAVHRNLAGTAVNSVEGSIPDNSWIDLAAPAASGPGWADLTMRATLAAGAGYDATGALRFSHTQSDAANSPASFAGPPLPLGPQIPAGGLTESHLSNLRLSFRFRANAGTAYNLRLDPDGNNPAASLTGLTLTPASGTAAAQDAADDFSDSVGAVRTRTVSAAGTGTAGLSGTVRNSVVLFNGAAMRSALFTVTEDNTPGSGTNAAPGALEFEVATAPAVPDFFGFTYQPVSVRSWTATAVTAAQLKTGAIQFDYHLPPGVQWQVHLESGIGTSTAADRLDLGTITGTGGWTTATLDTGSAGNATAFLSFLNSTSTNTVKVVFLNTGALPSGSKLKLDNLGYVPWRTYDVQLSAGTSNQAAFLSAVNAQAAPRFFPVFEKTGLAVSPAASILTMDDFALTLAKAGAGSNETLLPYASPGWSYFPGLAEPAGGVVEPADFAVPQGTSDFADWIELFNPSAVPVDLSNWTLTDNPAVPARFVFPAGTVLNAGAALVVVADGRATPAGAAWLHAPFSLAAEGEFVGLYNAAGQLMDSIEFPPQNPFHSWGRDPATGGGWGYLRHATPGKPNEGPWQSGQAAAPEFSVPGGFHTGPVAVALTSASPGAVIRYTVNGTEPTATTGTLYTGSFHLSPISDRIGHVIRARAFGGGLLPSPVSTRTFLINQHAGLRSAPAVLLTGDAGTTFYKPLGIFAIQGGSYIDSIWRPGNANDYNIPVGDGRLTDPDSSSRPYERPAFLEYYYPDGRPGFRENIGLRVSSSPYSRPRLVLSDFPARTLWAADATLKPSLNVFFRNDYGTPAISHPLIPETKVRSFSEFRLRAGKNDISTPFIRDEYLRRLWTDLGHQGSVGTFASVYLNGYLKGYYNLVERIREEFMRTHHHSTLDWDVNYIGVFENGDNVHWNTVLQPRLSANLTLKANWDALRQVLDVTNVADYILLNVYAAMWDWPHNNWAMARERSPSGIWRCYVWDAEGGFNMGGNKGPTYESLNLDLLPTSNNTPIPAMFRRLMTSPEFRLLFADRIQRHLFNDGALTDARLLARRTATHAEVGPLMAIAGLSPDAGWLTSWLHATAGRRASLFPKTTAPTAHGQWRDPHRDGNLADTLWPLTLPPVFSQHGGVAAPGYQLSITHAAPAESVVYYTFDGSDPRQWGGTAAPGALTYAAPVTLPGAVVTVKARVRHATTNEWSPLTEARFAPPAVPASAENTVVAEFMYNPPPVTPAETAAGVIDAQDFEYIVLRNIGTSPVNLAGLRFQQGITFDFAGMFNPVVDPGQEAVLARNASALRIRYGAAIDQVLAGQYDGSLSNGGETLRLEVTADAAPVKVFTYSDGSPWPAAADGRGPALRLIQPETNPNHNLAASWTATAALGGSPAGIPLNLTYSQWAAWTFSAAELSDAVRSGPAGDFDGDGLPNVIEFLAGTDPRGALTPPPVVPEIVPDPGGGQRLRMSFPRLQAAGGYSLVVQSSPDLTVWQNDFTLAGTAPQPDGTDRQTWEKPVAAGQARYYMRLKAVPAP